MQKVYADNMNIQMKITFVDGEETVRLWAFVSWRASGRWSGLLCWNRGRRRRRCSGWICGGGSSRSISVCIRRRRCRSGGSRRSCRNGWNRIAWKFCHGHASRFHCIKKHSWGTSLCGKKKYCAFLFLFCIE